jgi:lysophospholipase L1-like esterase
MDNLVHIWGGIDRKKIRHVFYIGYPYPPYLSEKQKIVFKYYNDQVKYNLCPSNKIVFIDLRDTISPLQAEYFMEDRIHPSDLTYKLMAKLIKEQFEKYRIF